MQTSEGAVEECVLAGDREVEVGVEVAVEWMGEELRKE